MATAALGLGQLVGPVLAGALADLLGSAAAPLVAAAAYGLGALLAALDQRWAARPNQLLGHHTIPPKH
jgi:MFS family permease